MLTNAEASRLSGMSFWQQLDEFLLSASVVVDRPRGSRHPRFPQWVYPLDYGYLEGTNGGDGAGIDVWLGSACRGRVTAVFSTYDPGKRDAEVKLVLGGNSEEIQMICDFLAPQPQSFVLTIRDAMPE